MSQHQKFGQPHRKRFSKTISFAKHIFGSFGRKTKYPFIHSRFNLRFDNNSHDYHDQKHFVFTTENSNDCSHQLRQEVVLVHISGSDLKVWLPRSNLLSLLVSIDRGSQAPNLYMCDLKGGVLRNTNISRYDSFNLKKIHQRVLQT